MRAARYIFDCYAPVHSTMQPQRNLRRSTRYPCEEEVKETEYLGKIGNMVFYT
jgi:hypothetical protein